MCDMCKKETGVDFTIETVDGKSKICPNCIAEIICGNTLSFREGKYTSEISGEPGAIRIWDVSGVYYDVTLDEATRLLGKGLMPNEFLKLLETHSSNEFELHDDFYDDRTGLAYQPYKDDKYLSDLKKYLKSGKCIAGTERDIAEFIKELENFE